MITLFPRSVLANSLPAHLPALGRVLLRKEAVDEGGDFLAGRLYGKVELLLLGLGSLEQTQMVDHVLDELRRHVRDPVHFFRSAS